MKIGVFDSGLGGLIITGALMKRLGRYDYLYLGDTKNLPYGEKTPEEVLRYTKAAMKYLIKQDCKLIVIACNTASSIALRTLQQNFIPKYSPKTKVLGVIVPTVEEAALSSQKKIGVVATRSTVQSHIYGIEIEKINPAITVDELATPDLVPAIEAGNFEKAEESVKAYLKHFKEIDSLILGCTHYPLLKKTFKKELPEHVRLISQDDFIADKLEDYLKRHPEIESALSQSGSKTFEVTEINKEYQKVAEMIIPGIVIQRTFVL